MLHVYVTNRQTKDTLIVLFNEIWNIIACVCLSSALMAESVMKDKAS